MGGSIVAFGLTELTGQGFATFKRRDVDPQILAYLTS
jgi:hypothetical protein